MIRDQSMPLWKYEDLLNADSRWALDEGSLHFESASRIHKALEKIATRLTEHGIPYAVTGPMAFFRHGFRRFTEWLDLLVTRDGLRAIHKHMIGHGYVQKFNRSKALRDTELGVRIEFFISGDFPGDAAPKPVVWPDPNSASIEIDGIRYLTPAALLEVTIASGGQGIRCLRDLADAQDFIKVLRLPLEFADKLHPSVRDKYFELWSYAQSARKWDESQ
jgi:hypothetical protein